MTRDELKIRTQQAINAIRVFKDKDYGWSEMEKMLYEILIELDDSDWQTGTPTEEGWYICAYGDNFFCANYLYPNGIWREHWGGTLLAWQRIEPYKEESNGI